MARFLWAALALAVSGIAAAAETAYVTDILMLGMHRVEDTSDQPFANLVSGTEVEVLERTSSYARVRTREGREGWVRSMFLVSEKPAQARLAELEAQVTALEAGLQRAEAARAAAEEQAVRLTREAESAAESTAALRGTLTRLNRENETYQARLERYRSTVPLSWAAAALALTAIAAFLGGLWCLDALMRRRYGGYRLY